ncbi:hypothetical protein E4U24_003449 [Claviceps purpurea]|nr:hypothetical protein E4U24_003449 [Claviceps purpurea]KAG6276451.1 hypothetical protein E4U47_008289 [Claviceps purpurea]
MGSFKAIILGASVVCAQSFSTSCLSDMATPAGVAYTTTEVVTALTTDCPIKTGTPAGGDECAKKCNEEYNACRVAPDANQSFCASKLASCVGYNPFTGGSFMSPTACSAGAGAAATAPAGGQGGDAECAKKCNEEYNACRVAPDANQSFCSSKLASCVGYNPFTGGNFMSPTACSAGAAATTPAAPAATAPAGSDGSAGGQGGDAECAKKCNEEYNACRVAPDANQSFCASKLASCVGYNPFTGGSFASPTACSAAATVEATGTGANPPVVTAGAGQITPALALLALGAIVLL